MTTTLYHAEANIIVKAPVKNQTKLHKILENYSIYSLHSEIQGETVRYSFYCNSKKLIELVAKTEKLKAKVFLIR